MTIMNILSSDEEHLRKSKRKISKDVASPSVEPGQQNSVQTPQKSKKKKKKASKSETLSSVKASDKYFQVEKSVAKSFGSTNGTSFSLLSLFGRDTVSEKQENEDEPVETREQYQQSPDKSRKSKEHNEIDVSGQQHKRVAALAGHHPPAPPRTRTKITKKSISPPNRTLFFIDADPRLSDGVKYFHRKLSEEQLWTKWSSGFKKDVRNLLTRPKRSIRMVSHGNENFLKKIKFPENN